MMTPMEAEKCWRAGIGGKKIGVVIRHGQRHVAEIPKLARRLRRERARQ